MNNNGASERHWLAVSQHMLVDVLLFAAAFVVACWLRFAIDELDNKLNLLWPAILMGSLLFGCALYTLGLYTIQNAHHNLFKRSALVALALAVVITGLLAFFSLNYSARIGRGVMIMGGSLAFALSLLHHTYLLHRFRNLRERVALIVTCVEDEAEALLLRDAGGHYLDLVGVILYGDYTLKHPFRVLGRVDDLSRIADQEQLERVLCTNHSMVDRTTCRHLNCSECEDSKRCTSRGILDSQLSRQFCQLRYSGVTVMPLISVFEEICQCVPVEMVTPQWLLSASGEPRMFYIRKLKRAFDIIVSLAGLFCLWPCLLAGIILVKVKSPKGPVFYRQTRSGRFGHPFTLLKLRTMRPDAETGDTAVWASSNDPRAIPGGNFLRRYRIDEIPQMWNVLRGEMSFVGPRPERPEFVAMLAEQIPFYRERLLMQPGITGWAQVNHPYAASVADARHKLEFDLYYAKNMSLFLDLFILLDTVRIILRGGVKKAAPASLLQKHIARRHQIAAAEAKLAEAAAAAPQGVA